MKIGWHVIVSSYRPDPSSKLDVQSVDWKRSQWSSLCFDSSQRIPFAISFDEIYNQLESMEYVFIELDGSFVWRPGPNATATGVAWQLDGIINEIQTQVGSIELKGHGLGGHGLGGHSDEQADPEMKSPLDTLLKMLDCPRDRLVVEIVQAGIHVSMDEFLEKLPVLEN